MQMFVKIYQYHIRKDKIETFLHIQEKAAEIYGQHLTFHTMYLNSKDEETKWMEISRFNDEDEYHRSIDMINKEEELQELYKKFQACLLSEIIEEDFIEKMEMKISSK